MASQAPTHAPARVINHCRHVTVWQCWLHHPEDLRSRKVAFQIHLWASVGACFYIAVVSLSGSVLVFRNALESLGRPDSRWDRFLLWLVDLHENLLAGEVGRRVNGIGALILVAIAITGAYLWWPGIAHWRRSLTVHRKSAFGRLNWELHNVLGLWSFLIVSAWGVSGFYFAFPEAFDPVARALNRLALHPHNEFGDLTLAWLANLHFGRFNVFTEILWTALGLIPAILLFTGVFMCCHRLLLRGIYRPGPPPR